VRRLGNLDSFSAFPYENNMAIFKRYCRKPGLPIQQFFNRIAEIKVHKINNNCDIDSSVHVSVQHNAANGSPQYNKITFNKMLLSIDMRDNCCFLHDGSVCIVVDIVMDNNLLYLLVVKKFLEIKDFYDVGILSSALQVYKCSTLSSEVYRIHLDDVRAKCYRMPLWNSTSEDNISSDEENHLEVVQYIVAAIIHSERM